MLIYEINKKTGNVTISVQRQASRKSLNKTVVMLALLFIIMTSPGAVVTSFLNSYLQTTGVGNIVIIFCDCITFGFHAFNFIVLFVTNKRFKEEVKNFFRKYNASPSTQGTSTGPSGKSKETLVTTRT